MKRTAAGGSACGSRLLRAGFAALGWTAGCATVGQIPDTSFTPAIAHPAYTSADGPVVCLDEGHFNFHTSTGRFLPFAETLRRDGYVVRAVSAPLSSSEALAGCQVLVIANALSKANQDHWTLPAYSAFSEAEIASVAQWVRDGRSLLLIADHMPFPGSAADLAAAFGILFSNGFATDSSRIPHRLVFRRTDGSLGDHPITHGRAAAERIDSVMTFVGQAFRAQAGVPVTALLVLPPKALLLMPSTAWKFSDKTPQLPASGLLQGAVAVFGRGRLAVFGEAAMFSAQVTGIDREPMGMNVPEASQNVQFLLNVVHWLSGVLPSP